MFIVVLQLRDHLLAATLKKMLSFHGRLVPFCERYFGGFFVIWGIVLIADHFSELATKGIFYGTLEDYLPGWLWGLILLSIGLCRGVAFVCNSAKWRLRLSMLTFIIMVVIASIAIYTRLWAATAPLSIFIALISFWCHKALIRDVNLGL